MKHLLTALLAFLSVTAFARRDTMSDNGSFLHPVYEWHSLQATLSLGFIDGHRNNYSLPVGFEKINTSGYTNVALKLDYALGKQISLAGNFGYDAFVYNYNQLYTGWAGTIRRHRINNCRTFYLGLIANYHLGNLISIKHLDPFIGVGISLNNTRYSAYPQGDSMLVKLEHTVTPYLKVGARYYISDKFSLFGDLGYEKQSIFSLGFSCRFFKNKDVK